MRMVRFSFLVVLFVVTFVISLPVQAQNFNVACDVTALYQAISDANGNGQDDIINLTAGCTYTLDSTTLSITDDAITINGNDAIISGNSNIRVFDVSNGATLTLNKATVRDGLVMAGNGGGIYNAGTLNINDSFILNNRSADDGAGIYNSSTLTIRRTTFEDNQASGDGGAVYSTGGTFDFEYGYVRRNSASFSGGGIYTNSITTLFEVVIGEADPITTENPADDGNSAQVGGGIYNVSSLTLTEISIIGNETTTSGAGLYNIGTATLSQVFVSFNEINTVGGSNIYGAGIWNSGTMTFTEGSVGVNALNDHFGNDTNSNYGGGGIYNEGAITLNAVSIFTNLADNGAGLYNSSGTTDQVILNNVTFFFNLGNFDGGAIFNDSGDITINNNTFKDNEVSSTNGSGSVFLLDNTGGNASLGFRNTIMDIDPLFNGSFNNCVNIGAANLLTGGGNVAEDSACVGSTLQNDTVVTSVGLEDPINGGLFYYFQPLSGSAAIDNQTSPSGTDCFLSSDQRTISRPQGGGCDSGSVEVVSNIAPTGVEDIYVTDPGVTLTVPANTGMLANDTDDGVGEMIVFLGTHPENGTYWGNLDGGFTYVPNAGFEGVDTFTYTIADKLAYVDTEVTVTIYVMENPPPIANPDLYTTVFGNPGVADLSIGVLNNDISPDGDPLTAIQVADGGPFNGTVDLNPDGSFVYSPLPLFIGTDAFTYVASDGVNLSNETFAFIEVEGITELPIGIGNMKILGDQTSIAFNPIFFWTHSSGESGDQSDLFVPAEWYRIVFQQQTGDPAFGFYTYDEWHPAPRLCVTVYCAFQLDVERDALIRNGTYSWQIQYWSAADGLSDLIPWNSTITLNIDEPGLIENIVTKPNEGRFSAEWDNDPDASWYLIRVQQDGQTVDLDWHKKIDVCGALTCTYVPDVVPENSTYEFTFRSWGPGGNGNNNQWTDPAPVTLDFSNTDVATPLTPTYINSGNPVFTWEAAEGGVWYNLWVGSPSFEESFNGWFPADELGCLNAGDICQIELPPDKLLGSGLYVWYVGTWGTAGFSTSGIGNTAYVEGDAFRVNASSTPIPIAGSPTSVISTVRPVFAWSHFDNISWYEVEIEVNFDGTFFKYTAPDQWFSASDLVCRDDNVCEAVLTADILPGDYRWRIRAYSPAGVGQWSGYVNFTVDLSGGDNTIGAYPELWYEYQDELQETYSLSQTPTSMFRQP